MRSTRRLQNLLGTLPKWYSISNAASPGLPTQVSIYDEIGFFGVPAGEFMADLKGIQGDIELHINSPGGDVHDGIAIYNQLKQRAGTIGVIVDGLAASAASFIAQAASPGKLEMAPHSQMMVHNGFSMGIGDAADLRKTADLLDMVTTEIASIYAERTGKPVEYWQAKMADETWFTAEQAVAEGLADKVHGQAAADDGWDLSVFANWEIVDETGEPPEQGSGRNRPAPAGRSNTRPVNAAGGSGYVKRDGKWVFDPDGDGDDDGHPDGDTDHDYWSADGHQLKAIPPDPDGKQGKPLPPAAKGPEYPVLNADVDNSPWDASKAWSAGADSDDPAAFYKGICAGRRAGDPSTQAAWALPYKYSPSSPPNAGGVRAALARFSQTQGLTNSGEAKATLERAMKQVNPDWEPDDEMDTELLAAAFAFGLEGASS
jgi:ATP-dependent Clp endopeptidase proteolytic subunit ClpP